MRLMSVKGTEAYSFTTAKKKWLTIGSYLFVCALIFGQFIPAWSGDNSLKSYGVVPTDIWNGRKVQDNRIISEVYVSVNPRLLTFKADGGRYKGLFRLEVSAYSPSGEMVESRYVEDEIVTTDVAQLKTHPGRKLCKLSFQLQPGNYKAFIRLIDLNTGEKNEFEKDWNVSTTLKNQFSVSDILFARQADLNGDNSTEILPYPAAIYGRVQNKMYFYFETYLKNGDSKDAVQVSVSILNAGNETVFFKRETQHFRNGYRPTFLSFDTADLPPGVYTAILKVNGSNGNTILRQKKFFVYQSPIDLKFRQYSQVLKEIALIATPEEMNRLRMVSETDRQHAINNFWRKKDRTPGTPPNETMLKFYQRVATARHLFWRGDAETGNFTDRGKVYVMYGRPRKVTHRTDTKSRTRYEVWIYPKQAIEAVFVDVMGINDYHLLQPLSLLSN